MSEKSFTEEIVGKSLHSLNQEEMHSFYGDFDDNAEVRATPVASAVVKETVKQGVKKSTNKCAGVLSLSGIGGAASSANDCLG
ncbi:mersacidin family lantibiotic [Staphylococcus hominis]|uniref:mersacidin family lantibiotic n=1 Tax=Staphylococcus hominis TaxID=1290 RepID=UPI002878420C|nr:mersacidin family lantibiotic [Staphylococcus hominis]MDS3898916.1 mersacidin family lantibiotic [Staphylococcus hominis]